MQSKGKGGRKLQYGRHCDAVLVCVVRGGPGGGVVRSFPAHHASGAAESGKGRRTLLRGLPWRWRWHRRHHSCRPRWMSRHRHHLCRPHSMSRLRHHLCRPRSMSRHCHHLFRWTSHRLRHSRHLFSLNRQHLRFCRQCSTARLRRRRLRPRPLSLAARSP